MLAFGVDSIARITHSCPCYSSVGLYLVGHDGAVCGQVEHCKVGVSGSKGWTRTGCMSSRLSVK
jgi:hypothetical protein